MRPIRLDITPVRNRRLGEEFAPTFRELDEKAMDAYREVWRPLLAERSRTLPEDARSESDHWDWEQIRSESASARCYALWRDYEELLALVHIREDGFLDRGEWGDAGERPILEPSIYVEYLDTSPLVQRRLLLPDEERPYDSLLPSLLAAIQRRSRAKRFGGRIVLHALGGAVSAYENADMVRVGMEQFPEGDYLLMRNRVGWKEDSGG